jgi:hypothetical protein
LFDLPDRLGILLEEKPSIDVVATDCCDGDEKVYVLEKNDDREATVAADTSECFEGEVSLLLFDPSSEWSDGSCE